MSPSSESALESRTTPVQQRGHARVDALLDAAAEIVDTAGIAAMTTSAIAERSDSSVGVVYRYFPNADAVLVALAERNRDQYAARITAAVGERQPADWKSFVTLCVDVHADMVRTVPGFRVIQQSNVVATRFASRETTHNEPIGHEFDDMLVEAYGFPRTEDLVFATQLAMECADAVTRRGFLHDRAGDPRFIEAAKKIIIGILTPHAPETYGEDLVP